ncbi:MAG: signal recognition particle subunit SRP19/SEC65 family protein [Candidatus Odinarchaeota archaeon]
MISDGMYRIYPEYLMHELSRREGRRISREKAVKELKMAEVRLSLEKLGCEFEFDENKAYPRQWWAKRGIFLVNKQTNNLESKQQLLEAISLEITRFVRPALEKYAKEQAAKQKSDKKKPVTRDPLKKRPAGARRRR